jgi:hypothetical protein
MLKARPRLPSADYLFHTAGVPFHEGGRVTKRNEDDANLLCIVDKQRTSVALFYSKATMRITSIVAIMFPDQMHVKLDEIWTNARSVTFGENGNYSIEFLPRGTQKN